MTLFSLLSLHLLNVERNWLTVEMIVINCWKRPIFSTIFTSPLWLGKNSENTEMSIGMIKNNKTLFGWSLGISLNISCIMYSMSLEMIAAILTFSFDWFNCFCYITGQFNKLWKNILEKDGDRETWIRSLGLIRGPGSPCISLRSLNTVNIT